MSSQRTTIAIFFIASLFILQFVSADNSEEEAEYSADKYQRIARAPKPKFIRFGRAGAKFIRFGRSGANTWDDEYVAPSNEVYVKRGAKFIRFG
ncbi:unnamed protein product [Caenorhabditis angaria]|uniref:Uncharacterized protein n=1 Tax=Caenorhabditis angaria TaxID=860376 RepID=A0A9P1IY93_9PELO|nr:unnamed protein product [Caenorhabditis angaria]